MEVIGIIASAANIGAGGGGEAYVADAVHFDGATELHIASLSATDNANLSFVKWFKITNPSPIASSVGVIFYGDPESNNTPSLQFSAEGDSAPVYVQFSQSPSYIEQLTAAFNNSVWNCLIASFTLVEGAEGLENIFKIYIGDTDVTNWVSRNDPGANPAFAFNGRSFWFGGDSYGGSDAVADFADVRIMPGVSLLTAGDIPLAKRRLFIDAEGKPVDPAIATAELGAQCILFSGDASGFAINQGTGGAFTLTGSLTNAATSPSD